MNDTDEENAPQIALGEITSRAASLLWRDRRWIAVPYLCFTLPSFAVNLSASGTIADQLGIILLWRMLHLLGSCLVFLPWLRSLRRAPGDTVGPLFRFFVAGLLVCIASLAPVMISELYDSPAAAFMATAVMTPPFIVLGLRFYFYQLPILSGVREPRSVLRIADSITRGRRLLPIILLVPPLGWLGLVSGLLHVPDPELKTALWDTATKLAGGLPWLLHSYLCLAAYLTRLANPDWVALDLQPYGAARFETLAVQCPEPFKRMLTIRTGFTALLTGAFVHLVNLSRIQELPPAPDFRVAGIEVSDKRVRVIVELKDTEHDLRSVAPFLFRLASERGVPLNKELPFPTHAVLPATGEEVLLRLPEPVHEARIALDFATTRTAQQLLPLEDLHLWYRSARLTRLSMKDATVLGSPTDLLSQLAPPAETPPAEAPNRSSNQP